MVLRMSSLDMESEALHSRGKIGCIRRGAEVTAWSTAGHGGHDRGDALATLLRQHNKSLSIKLGCCKVKRLCKNIQCQCDSYVLMITKSIDSNFPSRNSHSIFLASSSSVNVILGGVCFHRSATFSDGSASSWRCMISLTLQLTCNFAVLERKIRHKLKWNQIYQLCKVCES